MDSNITKHPKTLRIFFGTEMWERYGFYVVQTLLALYLTQHYNWTDDRTYALVSSFTALTYLSPLIGGWVADKLIGQKASIVLAIFFLMFSYSLLTFVDNDSALPLALATIAVGTGLLKPNISSLLGNEYPAGSSRRESGFTIFYMGITTGIILGTTVPSQLNSYLGWSAAFFSSVIGLFIALIIFSYGIFVYKLQNYNNIKHSWETILTAIMIIGLLWIFSFYLLNVPKLANLCFLLVFVLSSVYMINAIRSEDSIQSKQTMVLGLLCIISVIFWAFYFQMFLSFTLFITRVVQSELYGLIFPAPYYVTVQSLGMIFLGIFLSRKRLKLSLVARGENIAKKFLLSILCMIIAYACLVLASHSSADSLMISPLFIIPTYLMISLAELLLSPVGLSAVTILASREKVSTMMGIFFVSLGLGGFLSGKLAFITSIPPGVHDLVYLKSHYAQAFRSLMFILIALSFLCTGLYVIIRIILKGIARHTSLEA